MNIAFWSNVSGCSATSSNMLAVGTMASVLYCLKTVMVQTDSMSKPIEEVFEGKKSNASVNEEYQIYNRKGLNEIIARARGSFLDRGTVEKNMLKVKNTNIRYIPSAKGITANDSMDSMRAYQMLMRQLNNVSSLNFWDLSNGECLSSKVVMEACDVLVVNLCQKEGMYALPDKDERFIDKSVFIIGKYDGRSQRDFSHICYEYNIPQKKTGVIPYNLHYHRALQEGKIVPFIMKNIFSKDCDENFDFVNNLFSVTNIILTEAGIQGLGDM